MDYSDIGLDKHGLNMNRPLKGREFNQTINTDIRNERSPYLNPVAISKGSVLSTSGGITTLRDTTGGTILFTVDPDTGTVTIAGGVVVNQTVNIGTIYNSNFTGTLSNLGTLNFGVGTLGTLHNSVLTGGTVNAVAGTLDNVVLGSQSSQGGTVIQALLNACAIEGGTITSVKMTGTQLFDVNAGSAILGADGNLALQTYGTGIIISARLGGTTFRFTPSGTI